MFPSISDEAVVAMKNLSLLDLKKSFKCQEGSRTSVTDTTDSKAKFQTKQWRLAFIEISFTQ